VGEPTAGPDPRFAGKQLPVSRFAGDTGAADSALMRVLEAFANGSASLQQVQSAMLGTRVLIPTAASTDAVAVDQRTGLTTDTEPHLSVVSFVSEAGWHGLLAFTSVASAAQWDTAARPVPVPVEEAALAALEDGRSVLVIDLAGPVRVGITGAMLRATAAGRAWCPIDQDPAIARAVADALAGVPGVMGSQITPAIADDHDAVVLLDLASGMDVRAVAGQAAEVIAADPVVRERIDRGLAVGVAPPRG
jgi:hypothetical protein